LRRGAGAGDGRIGVLGWTFSLEPSTSAAASARSELYNLWCDALTSSSVLGFSIPFERWNSASLARASAVTRSSAAPAAFVAGWSTMLRRGERRRR